MVIESFIERINASIRADYARARELEAEKLEERVSLKEVLARLVADASAPPPILTETQFAKTLADMSDEPANDEAAVDYSELTYSDVVAEQCKRSLSRFVKEGWHITDKSTRLSWNWHHELICRVLQGVMEDWLANRADPTYRIRVQNLIINIPPGSLKSRIVAIFLPAWMWLRCPSWSIICLSVNNDAVKRDARISRELISSPWYRETFKIQWEIKDDQDAITNYGNSEGGSRLSKPSGSEIVGLRADLLLLDDPNNPKESNNEKAREEVNGTWTLNTGTRINDPLNSIRIIVQQNTHEDDLSHFVMKTEGLWSPEQEPGGMGWLRVALPAEFEVARRCVTPWGSDERIFEGQSLHESRFTKAYLEKELKRLGPYGYAGQYQQRPAPLEGGMFKRGWWRFCSLVTKPSWNPLNGQTIIEAIDQITWNVDQRVRVRLRPEKCAPIEAIALPNLDWVALSVDASFGSTEDDASRVGLLVVAGRGADRYVLHADAEVRTFLDTCEQIRKIHKMFPMITRTLVEKKANGPAIIETLKKEISGIVSYEPKGSKKERGHAMVPAIFAGNVYLLDGAPWLQRFLAEFSVFPKGETDDLVDTLGQILDHMSSSGLLPDW